MREYPNSGPDDQPQLTRFDEPLASDSSVEPALLPVQVTSSRWKALSARLSEVVCKVCLQLYMCVCVFVFMFVYVCMY